MENVRSMVIEDNKGRELGVTDCQEEEPFFNYVERDLCDSNSRRVTIVGSKYPGGVGEWECQEIEYEVTAKAKLFVDTCTYTCNCC